MRAPPRNRMVIPPKRWACWRCSGQQVDRRTEAGSDATGNGALRAARQPWPQNCARTDKINVSATSRLRKRGIWIRHANRRYHDASQKAPGENRGENPFELYKIGRHHVQNIQRSPDAFLARLLTFSLWNSVAGSA
jgi:hypothetical protein